MKLAILGGGGVRIPLFVRGVLSRPGTSFREICLFEPDQARRETIGRLAVEVAAALGHRGVVRVTPDAEEAFTGADFVFSAIRVGGDRAGSSTRRSPCGGAWSARRPPAPGAARWHCGPFPWCCPTAMRWPGTRPARS